ncbi:MAG: hypothetical protein KJT01_12700 [Gemmatimonadetes bacterium]|nr:hypothetical protein [Gemmatimonadota bacterium]
MRATAGTHRTESAAEPPAAVAAVGAGARDACGGIDGCDTGTPLPTAATSRAPRAAGGSEGTGVTDTGAVGVAIPATGAPARGASVPVTIGMALDGNPVRHAATATPSESTTPAARRYVDGCRHVGGGSTPHQWHGVSTRWR